MSEGTIAVHAARVAFDELARRGLDAGATLRRAGLSHEALASVDHRLPAGRVLQLWELAAEVAADGWFGVHAAETAAVGSYDLIEYIFSTTATVGDGLARLERYSRLIFDRSIWELDVEPRHARLARHVPRPSRQFDEFTLTFVVTRSWQSAGTRWTPERAELQHEHPDDDGELARFLGCPVRFGADATRLRLAPEVLKLPHVHADSQLLAILLRNADALLDAVPTRGDLVARVASAIMRQMARTLPSLASTAAEVRLPARTLQRRLAERGLSHSSILDDVRRDLAFKYLGDFRLGTSEIAYLLHFAEPAALVRAFRRWTGESPTQYRRRLVAG